MGCKQFSSLGRSQQGGPTRRSTHEPCIAVYAPREKGTRGRARWRRAADGGDRRALHVARHDLPGGGRGGPRPAVMCEAAQSLGPNPTRRAQPEIRASLCALRESRVLVGVLGGACVQRVYDVPRDVRHPRQQGEGPPLPRRSVQIAPTVMGSNPTRQATGKSTDLDERQYCYVVS